MRLVDPRPLPVVIERDQLEYLHTWHPWRGANWWRSIFAAAVAASSITVLTLDYFGRLA